MVSTRVGRVLTVMEYSINLSITPPISVVSTLSLRPLVYVTSIFVAHRRVRLLFLIGGSRQPLPCLPRLLSNLNLFHHLGPALHARSS